MIHRESACLPALMLWFERFRGQAVGQATQLRGHVGQRLFGVFEGCVGIACFLPGVFQIQSPLT